MINKSLKLKLNKLLGKEGIFDLEKKLKKKFKKVEVYLVGGALRDIIIGRKVKDFDVLVRGVKLKQLEAELKKYGRVDLVGRRFSVIKFVPKNTRLSRPNGDPLGSEYAPRNDRRG